MSNPFEDLKRRMDGAITAFTNELKGLRTGRASTSLLDTVQVEVYGSMMPLNQVASVSAPEARLLMVQVWDKGNVGAVEKAIRSADLGLNPMTDGQTVRVPTPELTEQRRQELVKVAHKYAEQQRIAIRNIRRDGMDGLKKDTSLSKDALHDEGEKIQKLTDSQIAKIDELLKTKEKEIMSI